MADGCDCRRSLFWKDGAPDSGFAGTGGRTSRGKPLRPLRPGVRRSTAAIDASPTELRETGTWGGSVGWLVLALHRAWSYTGRTRWAGQARQAGAESDVEKVGGNKQLEGHLGRHVEVGHVHTVLVLLVVVEVLDDLLEHRAVDVVQPDRVCRAFLERVRDHVFERAADAGGVLADGEVEAVARHERHIRRHTGLLLVGQRARLALVDRHRVCRASVCMDVCPVAVGASPPCVRPPGNVIVNMNPRIQSSRASRASRRRLCARLRRLYNRCSLTAATTATSSTTSTAVATSALCAEHPRPIEPTMPVSNPSLGWELLDTVYYRSRTCYESLDWPAEQAGFDLADYHIAIGPSAAVVALHPRTSSRLDAAHSSILVCSGAGHLLFSLPWNFVLNPIAKLGWTPDAQLAVVTRAGKYRIYYNYQGDFDEFDIFTELLNGGEDSDNDSENSASTVNDAVFARTGFAIQSSANHFAYIQNYRNPTRRTSVLCSQLATAEPIEPYHVTAWTLKSPPDNSPSSLAKLTFYIFTSAGLCVLSESTHRPVFSSRSPLTSISHVDIAPNTNFAALYSSESSALYILDGDFNDLLVQHDLERKPLAISWCSNDVVAVSHQDYISVIGPSADTLDFYTNGVPYLKGEIDGLYYLTDSELSFLSRVSQVTEETFRIGSTAPSAILLDAIDYLDRHSPKANDHLEIIDDNMVMAVDGCIRAASEEFDLYWQKNLLRAAAFGKVNLDLYDPTEFVQTCDSLRILNIIRGPEIGIFMTYAQFHSIGVEKVIDLLLLRQMHYLCLKIGDFLNLPNYKILTDWACCKLKYSSSANIDEDHLLATIYDKLKSSKIDWTHIAYVAYTEGRQKLARNLLSYEPDTSKKVQFLLDINSSATGDEMEYALTKADEDGDVDSLALILLELYGSLSSAEFFKEIGDKPNAIGILKSVVCQVDVKGDMLKNFMFQDDDIIGRLVLDIVSILKSKNIESTALTKLQSLAGRSKQTQSVVPYIKAETKLLKLQNDLLSTSHEIVPGEPILDTLRKIIPVDLKEAHAIAKKFSIPSKQYANLVLKVLAARSDKHAELYDYATIGGGGKALGFEVFYYELAKLGERRQSGMYLPLCKNMTARQKVRSYIFCGMWKEAVAEAGSKNEIKILKSMKESRSGWEAKVAADEIERLGK